MVKRDKGEEPENDNTPRANDNDKRPWKEREPEWVRAYHREYMRRRREKERRG
jgi:hypothetical protein